MTEVTEKKIVYNILRDTIASWNRKQWTAARTQKRRPKLLPSLIGIDKVHRAVIKGTTLEIDCEAAYRVPYSVRKSGEHKPLTHHFTLGRPRSGKVVAKISTNGPRYEISFPELKLEVQNEEVA